MSNLVLPLLQIMLPHRFRIRHALLVALLVPTAFVWAQTADSDMTAALKTIDAAKGYFDSLTNVKYKVEAKGTSDNGATLFAWTYSFVGAGSQFSLETTYLPEKPGGSLIRRRYARNDQIYQFLSGDQLSIQTLRNKDGTPSHLPPLVNTETKNYGALYLPWKFLAHDVDFDLNDSSQWSEKAKQFKTVLEKMGEVHRIIWNNRPAIEIKCLEQVGIFKKAKMHFAVTFAQGTQFPVRWTFTDQDGSGLIYEVVEVGSISVGDHEIYYPKSAVEKVMSNDPAKVNPPFSSNEMMITSFEIQSYDQDEFTIDPVFAKQILDLDANIAIPVPK